jgi:S1/P1 Nuclease
MMAATAADAIKKHGSTFHDDGEDPTAAPDASRNAGFDDKNMHKYWHYTDRPFSPDGTPLIQPPSINAQERIGLFRHTIASASTPDTLKAYDLVWLLHLVGDVHQPLHATSRFTHANPQGDNGGNKEKVCNPSCGGKLHAFWDDVLGTSDSVTTAINAARALPKADPTQSSIADEAAWVDESFQTAQQFAYRAPIGAGNGPFTLTNAYKIAAKNEARKRIALAGGRLANMLNNELKQPSVSGMACSRNIEMRWNLSHNGD